MEAGIAIGGLILLVVLAVWALVSEAKSGAVRKEALSTANEVIDGMERFNKARRDSAGLPRIERLAFLLQEIRARPRPELSIDE
jgi:hypothetical protein